MDEKQGKSPAFQLYPKDLLADTAWLTNEQLGVYVRFLCYAWIGLPGCPQGRLPVSVDRLLPLVQLSPEQWERMKSMVLQYFQENNDGTMSNPRLEKELQKQLSNRENKRNAGLASARSRNGTPTAPQQKSDSRSTAVQTEGQQNSALHLQLHASSSDKNARAPFEQSGNRASTGSVRRHSRETYERYAASQPGIKNPTAYAKTIAASGDDDDLIDRWLRNGDGRDEWKGYFLGLLRGYKEALTPPDERLELIRSAIDLIPRCASRTDFQSTLEELRESGLEL